MVKKLLPLVLLTSFTFSGCGQDIPEQIVWGKKNAQVQIEAYLDFQCPGCKQFFEDDFALLKKEFIDTGKVSFRFIDYPAHQKSTNAHITFHCAEEQGMGTQMASLLYSTQDQNTIGLYRAHAKTLGLNKEQFSTCLESDKYTSLITANKELGRKRGINYTPAIFIGEERLPSLGGYDEFRKKILEVVK